jgi:hypothetical protein
MAALADDGCAAPLEIGIPANPYRVHCASYASAAWLV